MKIKTVIFDLDGTLGDTLPLCIAAFRNSIEPLLGKVISDEEIIAAFGTSEEGTIRKLIPEHEVEGIKSFLYYYEQMHGTCPVPFAEIPELLALLKAKGVQLAMVTGKGIHSAQLSLKKFKLEQFFEILETGKAEGPDKVNGIRRVLEKLNADPAESIYVGDATSDVLSCKEVGLPIAAAAWATTANEQELAALNPEWLFTSVADFKTWILNNIFTPY